MPSKTKPPVPSNHLHPEMASAAHMRDMRKRYDGVDEFVDVENLQREVKEEKAELDRLKAELKDAKRKLARKNKELRKKVREEKKK